MTTQPPADQATPSVVEAVARADAGWSPDEVQALRERFNRFVDRSGDCWPFMGSRTPQGYGQITVRGKNRRATHVALFLETGEWLAHGIFACHRCDNPPCVNPFHLFLGTNSDNIRDAFRKGRKTPAKCPPEKLARGSRQGCAKLNEHQVKEIKRRLAAGELCTVIAEEVGVHETTIGAIKHGRTWSHV